MNNETLQTETKMRYRVEQITTNHIVGTKHWAVIDTVDDIEICDVTWTESDAKAEAFKMSLRDRIAKELPGFPFEITVI